MNLVFTCTIITFFVKEKHVSCCITCTYQSMSARTHARFPRPDKSNTTTTDNDRNTLQSKAG
eukprot:m.1392108 g.1392108  ORF g.1392108 m.1392108 type:complete len:62 (+) comp24991_c0_seq57:3041-3226(+)